ncbi:hypothetical protein [Cardinium endosymbiont of Culicoides punctatus]|uniref:hypothetical protein n=1 Tax=Cardinium endosymbiont of Culicoides punctatus TaxID=2304601 RepID=UPI00105910DB|nr:hypothetical protein [Cardinium endosymbiont of Culicoides punctatus]TDG93273.1 hypothetical protein CCPUN_09290 [Cardinium endosymbiont of Culicoides punctatus]
MNYRLLFVWIVSSFLVGLGGLDISLPTFPWSAHAISRNGCKKYDRATFAEKIIAIDCKIKDGTSPHSLFQSKDFIGIYQHPQYYYSHIWSVLHSRWFSQRQKIIVAYAMSQLPLTDYISFLEKSYELYRTGYLEVDVLSTMLGNKPITHTHPIITHIQDAKVTNILLYIQMDKKIGHVVEYLKQMCINNYHSDLETEKEFLRPPISLKAMIEDIIAKEKQKQKQTDPIIYKDVLLSYSNFIEIYTHPDCYFAEALAYIKQGRYTRVHYRILRDAMTHLKAENYARLVEAFCTAYLKGDISVNILISCNTGCRSYFIYHYKHPMLQRILNDITTNQQLPVRFKLSIADVKSGKEKMIHSYHKEMNKSFCFHEDIAARWYADAMVILYIFIFVCYRWIKYLLQKY